MGYRDCHKGKIIPLRFSAKLREKRKKKMILKKKAYQTHELLLGAWRLVSWEARDATGRIFYPLAEDARGQLSYDGSGRMSAQLMRQHQARFASQDWRQASEKEKAAAWGNYFGYFGTYPIDENAGTVTHHIEGSWFPNLIGTQQVRRYRFQRNQLVLNADTEWGQVKIVWKRV
jgi:hypothetical protein